MRVRFEVPESIGFCFNWLGELSNVRKILSSVMPGGDSVPAVSHGMRL